MSERERIDRFEAAFNSIDRQLGSLIGDSTERRHSFASRVRIASNKRRRLSRFTDFLLEIGELRNALVHSRTQVDHYLAVPSQETVTQLESILADITAPARIMPRYARRVLTLDASRTLAEAWELIRHDGYTRYPVYEKDAFVGLLTPNGFTRWCAQHVDHGRLSIDMNTVRVAHVLDVDPRRDAALFLASDAPIDDAILAYAENPRLETILITEHGRSAEPPLGMISAGDAAAAAKELKF